MAIEFKDYYEILGIEHTASGDEIRNAFRKLARHFHPDKTGSNPEAENRFKEINEAYEVLGDPTKRQRYDKFAGTWRGAKSNGPGRREFASRDGAFSTDPGRFRFDGAGFSEFFDELFGQQGERPRSPRETHRPATHNIPPSDPRGDDLEADIWVTLEEVARGAVRPISMKRAQKCGNCLGMGQLNGSPCESCDGTGNQVRSETYKVKIPRGVRPGAFLRVPGRGEEGVVSGQTGDLYLKVNYTAHAEFYVEHDTLHHDLELAPWEAVLGALVSVPTLEGRATIKIPAGTQNGRKLRLKLQGLPDSAGQRGDLMLRVKVQVPAEPGLRERRLWEELARESDFHPRGN